MAKSDAVGGHSVVVVKPASQLLAMGFSASAAVRACIRPSCIRVILSLLRWQCSRSGQSFLLVNRSCWAALGT